MSLLRTPLPLALDLSDHALKILALAEDRHGKLFVRDAITLLLPKGMVDHGVIQRMDDLVALAKPSVKKLIPTHNHTSATIALPEDHTFVTLLTLPASSESKRDAETILEEAKRHIPMTEDDMYWDAAETSDPSRILFGTSLKVIADSYATFLEHVGLIPLALEIESVAIARALQEKTREGTIALLDCGATRTGLLVLQHNLLAMTMQLPMSGNTITEKIQTTLKCDETTAEEMKRTKGWNEAALDGAVKEVMRAERERLGAALKDAFAFFQTKNETATIQHVFLLGGGAALAGIDEALTADLGIPVSRAELAIPFHEQRTLPLEYATAYGLALGGIQLVKTI